MQLYIITKLFYKKNTSPADTIHSSVEYVTADLEKAKARYNEIQTEVETFLQLDCDNLNLTKNASGSRLDAIPPNYIYTSNTMYFFLTFDTVENTIYREQNTLKKYDVATFKPDSIPHLSSKADWDRLRNAEAVVIKAIDSSNNCSIQVIKSKNDNQDFGHLNVVPVDYLQKVNL